MKKRLFAVFALIAIVATCTLGLAGCNTDNGSGGLVYTLTEDKTSYQCSGLGTCNDTEIRIASSYKGKPVTKIAVKAFSGSTSFEKVTVPGTISDIDYRAFSDCYLLETVILEDGVTSISMDAFINCSRLTDISIPDSVSSISKTAFDGCDSLKQTENGIIYVDTWAVGFESTATKINLRVGTRGIADNAFYNFNTATKVTMPDTLLHIGNYALRKNTKLLTVIIPDSVITIGTNAFEECTALKTIIIGNSVKIIDCYAFSECIMLETITVPDSTTIIEMAAFYHCQSLKILNIGSGVTHLGSAFIECYSLSTINYNGTMAEWLAIEKDILWDDYSADFVVNCRDGRLNALGEEV